jgi:hypothetical protein
MNRTLAGHRAVDSCLLIACGSYSSGGRAVWVGSRAGRRCAARSRIHLWLGCVCPPWNVINWIVGGLLWVVRILTCCWISPSVWTDYEAESGTPKRARLADGMVSALSVCPWRSCAQHPLGWPAPPPSSACHGALVGGPGALLRPNRIQFVVFGMQIRTAGPYLATLFRIHVPAMPGWLLTEQRHHGKGW